MGVFDTAINFCRGSLGNLFRIGPAGPQIKNASGVVEFRNATDAAYASGKVDTLTVVTGVNTTTATELGYVHGVTSAIQGQIDAKTTTTFVTSAVSTHAALTAVHGVTTVAGISEVQTFTNKTISGSSNTLSNIAQSSITNLTSDLALKAPLASPTFTGTATFATGAFSSLSVGTLTNTELSYVHGVTSAIQTQLDAKASSASVSTAISQTHTQNTDTGTTGQSFQLQSGSSGFKLKNNTGVAEIRNAADSAYVGLTAGSMTGTTGKFTTSILLGAGAADHLAQLTGDVFGNFVYTSTLTGLSTTIGADGSFTTTGGARAANADLSGSTTSMTSLRIRSGTAPTSPNDGDIWYDGTNLKMRVGITTKTFTLI